MDRTAMTATISSVEPSSKVGGCHASNAIDGIFQTTADNLPEMACTETGDVNPWLQLDLGRPHSVHEASIMKGC